MNISIVLAQIVGISFMILGVSLFLNKKGTALVIEEMIQNKSVMWLAGLFTVFLGAVIVVLNNVWTSGLSLAVTILGWVTLIKGATILLFPEFTLSYYKKVNKGNIFAWGGAFIFVIGLLLFFSA